VARRKFGFSFSAKRALGISSLKSKISKKIGVPLTESGRRRKFGPFGMLLWPFSFAKSQDGDASNVACGCVGCGCFSVVLLGVVVVIVVVLMT
jgi:hypothetical protein